MAYGAAHPPRRRHNGRHAATAHRWALGAFAVIFAVSWWRPQWPVEQALHHSLTVLAVVGLLWAQRRWKLPFSSFVLALTFLTLHTIAARWIYSYVPYQEWFPALAGERNHFDRLVHLAWGLLLAPIVVQVLRDRGWRHGSALLVAVQAVVAVGALYEILEWGISLTLAPDAVEAYNGQQGDMFDPQKDQALALAGALIAGALALLPRRGIPSARRRDLDRAFAKTAHIEVIADPEAHYRSLSASLQGPVDGGGDVGHREES